MKPRMFMGEPSTLMLVFVFLFRALIALLAILYSSVRWNPPFPLFPATRTRWSRASTASCRRIPTLSRSCRSWRPRGTWSASRLGHRPLTLPGRPWTLSVGERISTTLKSTPVRRRHTFRGILNYGRRDHSVSIFFPARVVEFLLSVHFATMLNPVSLFSCAV